jgi:uncharacterized membrane protein
VIVPDHGARRQPVSLIAARPRLCGEHPRSSGHWRNGRPMCMLGCVDLYDVTARPLVTLNTKVVVLALTVAALTAAGTFFQKINGVRVGHMFLSGWILLATFCFFPTFLITNKVFLMGGKMSVFVPLTAATYVFSMLAGRFYFGETLSWDKWFGCLLIILGVGTIARG